MTVASAAAARMSADATLTADLATYRAAPAIVVTDDGTLPEDVTTPFVAVLGNEVDEPNDCKVEEGRDQTLLVRCYADATGSTVLIERIAERIRFLFHRKPADLTAGAYLAECSGPIPAPTDSSLYGREVTVRVASRSD